MMFTVFSVEVAVVVVVLLEILVVVVLEAVVGEGGMLGQVSQT